MLDVLSHVSTDGIKLNVSHRGQYRLLAEQRARVESLIEEMTAKLDVAIGLACNRLFEMLHESGHRAEAFAYAPNFFRCGAQCVHACPSKLCIFEYRP